MTQPTLFDLGPEVDPEWERKAARFEVLIDLSLDGKATNEELLELAALHNERERRARG